MGKVDWGGGFTAEDIDKADRGFTPYAGPQPPAGMYKFKLKVLRRRTSSKGNPQLMLGLELVPRKESEKKFKGYFLTHFITITDGTLFRLAPFLDAIGVKGKDFISRTVEDEDQNIKKIGKWVNDGKQELMVSIGLDNQQRWEAKNFAPVPEDVDDVDDDADDADEDDDDAPF